MTVPSVQNATVRTPLTVPAAASTPERSRSCSSSTVPSSKKVRQPQQRIAGVERFADRLGGHGRHLCHVAALDVRQYFPKASATLCPPNPNELLIAYS